MIVAKPDAEIAALSGSASETISHRHPAFAGHFPGDPLLPGVVLLDKLLQHMQTQLSPALDAMRADIRVESVKFLRSVRPDDEVTFTWNGSVAGDDWRFRFRVDCRAEPVAQGVLQLSLPVSQASGGNDGCQ